MKSLKYIIIGLLSIGLFNCKDSFLDVNPVDRYVYYNYLEKESQVDNAIAGGYRKIFDIYNSQYWIYGEMLSDNSSYNYNASDRGGANLENIDEFIASAENGEFNAMFQESFNGIQRSNFVLEKIDSITFAVPANKTLRKAEARFMRAWHYFNLVRIYGEVPVILSTETIPDNEIAIKYPRLPVSEVYKQVIEPDARFAIDNLPETWDKTNTGRASKGAAIMLMAHVLVTQKKFSQADLELQKLKGYTLQSDYKANFDITKKNGSESIFEIQCDPAQNLAFGFQSRWVPWGSGTTLWARDVGSRSGINQPTNNLNAAYTTADKRKAVVINSWTTTAARGTTLLYFNKYNNYDVAARQNASNWPVYRFADAILLRAECLGETSYPNPQALTLLNQIRTRAGLTALADSTIKSKQQFLDAVQQERRLELAGEAHRWFDLVRTDRADAVMKAHGEEEKRLKATLSSLKDRPAAYTKISLVAPYPRREREIFRYPQTPGW
ncbi:MAG: RagB/SusD family nutrient uptake outer membrane protein [Leadbetterella sp.]